MWMQVLFVVAFALAAAEGMCFGAPPIQQTITCPDAMVYSQELCICIDARFNTRLQGNVGFVNDASRHSFNPFDPMLTYKQRLLSLRHRLVTNLPDKSLSSYARSIAGMPLTPDNSLFSYGDRSYQSNNPMWFPKIHKGATTHRGETASLPEYWRYVKPAISFHQQHQSDMNKLPKIISVAKQMRPTPIHLVETLESKRGAWRAAAMKQAQNRFGNQALAKKFFSLATRGVSPDASRGFKQVKNNGFAPDSPRNRDFYEIPNNNVRSLLDLKEAAFMKYGLKNILPQHTVRHTTSFM